ncbi:hypothetical protein JCM14244_11020 [Venenivibrio stagnispumantis]|uniref:DUF2281 domain-containing protein n=1 Tax=Venenivibrio stagnispumantis TaxID=407998 RepID=A0AA46ADU6_9AQUI|nr:DUF2281 domain-containing protein [Venenivibrio stagnispumantis]MCW4572991.1 DUF2281 domain-containing protein [Venenivibrio stagnispumantis]SMP07919.1 Protein of unknown function [Venenivibrio stagnispumantis]
MQTINLNELPEEAQKELLDFYEFLLQKYKKKKTKKKIEEIIPRKVKEFTPIKREEIYER